MISEITMHIIIKSAFGADHKNIVVVFPDQIKSVIIIFRAVCVAPYLVALMVGFYQEQITPRFEPSGITEQIITVVVSRNYPEP